MALIAEEMIFDAVNATPTATARVTFALNSHTCQFKPLKNDNNELNTFGPQRFCLVTQQTSVRQTEPRTQQSQPKRFIRILFNSF